EEPKTIVATYVQDMAKINEDGSFPDTAWMDARQAWYLIKSRYIGGMGSYDALPFSDEDSANSYRQRYGGEIARFDEVPEDYIFGVAQPPARVSIPGAGVPPAQARAAAAPDGAKQ